MYGNDLLWSAIHHDNVDLVRDWFQIDAENRTPYSDILLAGGDRVVAAMREGETEQAFEILREVAREMAQRRDEIL